MGSSLSWYAVRGKTPEDVISDFGLQKAGQGYLATPYSGALLPGGLYLLIHGRHKFTNAEVMLLSQGCEVIACFVDERVMVSKVACWKHGSEVWSVTHNAQKDLLHLDVLGEPPSGFTAIRDSLTKQQEAADNVDYIFDIPVKLAAELTGFSHDDDSDEDITFENLVKPKPTLFQRLFRR